MKKIRTARVVLHDSLQSIPPNAKRSGTLDPDARMDVTLRLRRKHPTPARVSRFLSREEFQKRYGADPKDVALVEEFAHQYGFDVTQTSLAQRSVRLSGPIAAMQKAFGVTLHCYKSGKATFRGRTGRISLPKEIATAVEAVFGLDNRPHVRPQFHFGRTTGARAPKAGAARPMTALEVAKLYNFPAKLTGAGQTIAILEFGGGFRAPDLTTYFQGLGLKPPAVTAVSVLGGHNDPDGPAKDANGEVMLDIEVAGAVAPGAKIAVYFAPNSDDGFIGALQAAIHDNVRKPSIISISWGGPESSSTAQSVADYDSACADAALMGITITCAAGDHGAADSDQPADKRVNADFPASSPNVLACGGSRLIGQGSAIQSETVWNSKDGWATGGGVSEIFPVPAYQKKVTLPKSLNPGGKSGRGVPDVSGNADSATGYLIRVDGANVVVGGTSAVAPLWAGLVALLNQGSGKLSGLLNTRLYALSSASGAFNDIVTGDNIVAPAPGYTAKAGWDACSGLGSPNGAKILAAL